MAVHATTAPDRAYDRIAGAIAEERCVILDGATGTELIDSAGRRPESDERFWGVGALVDAPADVKHVHRQYVDAGVDLLSTNTWGLPTALREGALLGGDSSRPVHWMDVARRGVSLAREAIADAGRPDPVAVAFSLNGDVDGADGTETIRLLARAFELDPPDLILLETLSLVRDSTYDTVTALLDTGLPVWLSFRRCRHGVCGVYGEHWGGPEGDSFGRAARRFEQMGVTALLVNCIPPDHVTGMLSWLRDFTDLPLGVYPNLGYLSSAGWRTETKIGGAEYAALALQWREEGAQIVGGCCGVGPEHIATAAAALADTKPGRRQPELLQTAPEQPPAPPAPWSDRQGRAVFPLDFPELLADGGAVAPDPASLMVWKHLYRERTGAHQRCVDIGCGTGLLAVQLARNGAAHVHAIDVSAAAVRSTLTNASRNGVAHRVTAAVDDLFPWVPAERYDVIVANLPQVPADPLRHSATHRPVDFWGRNLIDQLIKVLPEALARDGVAYIVQLSTVGSRRTTQLLQRASCSARIVDFAFMDVDDRTRDQVARVEELSDAYHLRLGERDLSVAYLLEITKD